MARVPYPDTDKIGPKTRELLSQLPPLNIFRMMAHAETLAGPFVRLGNAILNKSDLDPVLREIAILRVGHLSDAAYEVAQHEQIGRALNMSDELLGAIKTDADNLVFTPLEAQVMRYTDELVKNVKCADDLFEALSDQLSVGELQELTLTVGYYMMVCRFLENFEVGMEDSEFAAGVIT